jgi:hypothetical protein
LGDKPTETEPKSRSERRSEEPPQEDDDKGYVWENKRPYVGVVKGEQRVVGILVVVWMILGSVYEECTKPEVIVVRVMFAELAEPSMMSGCGAADYWLSVLVSPVCGALLDARQLRL